MKLSWLIMTLYILILLGFFGLAMQSCVSVTVNSGTDNSEETQDKEVNIGIGEFDD